MTEARIYDDFDWGLIRALIGGNSVRIKIQGDRNSGYISVEAVVLDKTGLRLAGREKEVDMRVFETTSSCYSNIFPAVEDVARKVVEEIAERKKEVEEE